MDDIPTHVAIIMDGNGRWAKKRNLPRLQGHRAGVNAVRRVIDESLDLKIKYLTLFAFSKENWERPKMEVNGLMHLFTKVIEEEIENLKSHKVRVRFLGRLKELPDKVEESVNLIQEKTKYFNNLNLIIALNYSGREELIDAVNKAISKGKTVDEESFKEYLYIPDIPDPDLLIRTSGEVRISNFLLYEIAYTELYFTPTLWPDFGRNDLLKAITSYQKRERKFGKVI